MSASPFHRALLFVLALLGGALVVAAPVRADSGSVDERANLRINLLPCVKPVAPGDRAADLVRQPAAFDCTARQTQYGAGDYWLRMAVPDDAPAGATRLRWSSVWQDHATVTAYYADKTTRQIEVPSAESGRFVHIGAIYTITLRRDAVPQLLLVRVSGAANLRGIMLGLHLASAEHVARVDVQRAALYGGFVGLCLALLTYQLVLWRALNRNYLRAYGAMIAACLGYAFTSSAALAQMVPMIDNNLRLRLNYAGLAATAICAMWFIRSFLDNVGFSRRFDRAIQLAAALVALATVAFLFLSPWQIALLDRLYAGSFVLLLGLGAATFLRGWQRGGRLERLFVVAWLVPLIFNAARLLHSFDLIPQNFWLDNATLMAMSAEALLSSLIIAHRLRKVQVDRDSARADVAEARQLADTDELTGLFNRRALMRTACPPPGHAGMYRLVLIDVDHFKRINDCIGHSAGDGVLCRIADLIDAGRRPDAIAARIGGEEFAIIYKSDPADRRFHIGLLDQVRALPPAGDRPITVSMGAATGWLGGSETEWLALYRAADQALYQAKAAGRDRLIVAPYDGETKHAEAA